MMVRLAFDEVQMQQGLASKVESDATSPVVFRKTLKILLAEDDAALRLLFSRELDRAGFLVCSADNGKKALDAALAEKPDLIITDIMMPVMSGIELIENVKRAPGISDVPIIAMSATQNDGLVALIMKMGVKGFLRKPMDDGLLVRTVLDFEQISSHVGGDCGKGF